MVISHWFKINIGKIGSGKRNLETINGYVLTQEFSDTDDPYLYSSSKQFTTINDLADYIISVGEQLKLANDKKETNNDDNETTTCCTS